MNPNPQPNDRPVRLAYWYFRLNGFLILENFIVHDDTSANQRTDADILAVRFNHRSENRIRPMIDDAKVAECNALCNVIIAEVKTSRCALNGPWTRREDQNVQRVLAAIGCLPPNLCDDAAESLYSKGKYVGEQAAIRLIACGDQQAQLKPKIRQILFDDMLKFIYRRFREYRLQKASHGQWDADGKKLWDLSHMGNTPDYLKQARQYFDLPQTSRQEDDGTTARNKD